MKKITSVLVAGLLTLGLAQAQTQTGVCGTSMADQQLSEARLLQNLEHASMASDRGSVPQYVPIHFHLVANTAGQGRIKETRVLDQLCELNASYECNEMRFYLKPHPTHGLFDKSINNDAVYDSQDNLFIMENRRHTSALNVFVTNVADSGNPNPIGIVLAYYSPSKDWIVSRKDQISGTGNGTLVHEVGHFFSLRHTFYGWESDPFTNGSPGWPTAPAVSPGGVATERMNMSNCNSAADLICDTPPDYNFGIIDNDCVYTGGAKDPLGVTVDPMENNYMGYFANCNYAFTPQQCDVVLEDLNTPQRNYLDNTFTPAAETITTPEALLVLPAGADTVDAFDQVTFEWQNVPGATYYLFEIDIVSSYTTPNAQTFLLTGTSHTLTNLQANRKYFWRVRPFNEYYTCSPAKQSFFNTPAVVATDNVAGLTGWEVSPNPLNSGNAARVLINTETGFEAALGVFDATGRQVYRQEGSVFPAGNSVFELSLGDLPDGLYFIVLENATGRAVRKLVVLR